MNVSDDLLYTRWHSTRRYDSIRDGILLDGMTGLKSQLLLQYQEVPD